MRNMKSPLAFLESARKDCQGVNVSPLCKELFQSIRQIGNPIKDSKSAYQLHSPSSSNKLASCMSPAQNDSFLGFKKDDFQLKNGSDQKHLKMIDFPYPDNLLSKSDSSKKINFKQIMQGNDLDDQGGLKRRLFEKESSEYELEENSNYNVLSYNENPCLVENLITPPPKTTRRINHHITDHKQSGVKYVQNESLEKIQQLDPSHPYYNVPIPVSSQYASQVIYKSYKCKQSSYPYLIPFCNKCNLPPILPMHPDFEMEMVPPTSMQQMPPVQPRSERESPRHEPQPSQMNRPKTKTRLKKKPCVDENGKKIIRRRKRKTYEQLQQLIREFQANPEWSKENMQEVSNKTGLSEAQVYKWGWDQKRKMLDPTHDLHAELKMYKKHQDEEDEYEEYEEQESSIHRLQLPSSVKKSNKHSEGFHKQKEKHSQKIRSSNQSDNKENEFCKNKSNKRETRGVKRKLKMLNTHSKENEAFRQHA